MSDIVKELLSRASDEDGIGWTPTTVIPVPARLLHHAADRIEQLEAEGDKARARGDKLRMALEDIAYPNPLHNEDDMMRIARAALEDK